VKLQVGAKPIRPSRSASATRFLLAGRGGYGGRGSITRSGTATRPPRLSRTESIQPSHKRPVKRWRYDHATGSLGTGDLIINGIAIEGAKSASDTASAYANEASAISTAAAINEKSAQTGVTAVVGETQGRRQCHDRCFSSCLSCCRERHHRTQWSRYLDLDQCGIVDFSVTADNAANRAAIIEAINLEV
jgi:hypothetical protein